MALLLVSHSVHAAYVAKGTNMKKTPGKTPAAREKYWTKIIEEARRYPKGITEYCRIMNISKNNYYFWFKRLRPQHPEWHDLTNHPEVIVPHRPLKQTNNGGNREEDPRPATEVDARPRRRKWSAADRERILKETDSLSAGDLSACLRREAVYVHTLNKWRTERDLRNIATSKNSKVPNPLSSENKKLKEENARLQQRLKQANEIIQLQKKISHMLTMTLDGNDEA
jgi:transposase